MPQKEFLLIGRGLAGSILSLRLSAKGIAHDIVDSPTLSLSSKVAAGIINPIVLKRLKLVAGAPKFIDTAFHFYREHQQSSKTDFFKEWPIAHIFHSVGEINQWYEKQANPSYADFLGSVVENKHAHIEAPHGLGLMKNTAWLDTNSFLDYHKEQLPEAVALMDQMISPKQLSDLQKEYHSVVLCTGHLMDHLIPGVADFFSPTRGEILIVESDDLPSDQIMHGPIFILPIGENRFKVGATYSWDTLEDKTTEQGLQRLTNDLSKIFSGRYRIVDHLAGVRPNIKDRKPLLGRISGNLCCFNGLGSRGALMAPWLADHLLNHILDGQPIEPELSLDRFAK